MIRRVALAALLFLTCAGKIYAQEATVIRGGLSSLTNALGANVGLTNTAQYFDGPAIAQGSTGTWFASGTVTVEDGAGAATISCKLWDGGSNIIASSGVRTAGAALIGSISLSGYLTSPGGNLRISCKDFTSTSGTIDFNSAGTGSSVISAFRIN